MFRNNRNYSQGSVIARMFRTSAKVEVSTVRPRCGQKLKDNRATRTESPHWSRILEDTKTFQATGQPRVDMPLHLQSRSL
jgi:hypothetical protein